MKNRILVCGLILALAAGTSAGPGKKEVDYSLGEDGTEIDKSNASADLEPYKDVANWKEEWKVIGADGVEQRLSVDAEVTVPDTDSMSVVEVARVNADAAFSENFLKKFFDGEEVYYDDEAHMTTGEINDAIAELEEWMEEPDMDADTKQSIEDVVEKYEEMLETASDDYTAAENFDSCSQYTGYKEGVQYNVALSGSYISVELDESEYYGPETLRDYPFVEEVEGYEAADNDVVNECTYSMEEAQSIAEDFMTAIGRSGQICVEKKPIMWHGQNLETAEEAYQLYGYHFVYGSGVGDIAFTQFPDRWDYDASWEEERHFIIPGEDLDSERSGEAGEEAYDILGMYNGDRIEITITDRGVEAVAIEAPIKITNITESVDLLPLDTIKNIMKNEVAENVDEYNFEWSKKFNSMQLMYLKLQENALEGTYTYVPVWCLAHKQEMDLYSHPVLVNAISGNVIYLMDVKAE